MLHAAKGDLKPHGLFLVSYNLFLYIKAITYVREQSSFQQNHLIFFSNWRKKKSGSYHAKCIALQVNIRRSPNYSWNEYEKESTLLPPELMRGLIIAMPEVVQLSSIKGLLISLSNYLPTCALSIPLQFEFCPLHSICKTNGSL